ncbi:uncharacterized protein LOC141817783 [Curcuma longa]|uniref:uncharacterized protein LOC141817783 n=1 Tax=Curcuma longa TaxID=136217 RepID=UPI003D9E448E
MTVFIYEFAGIGFKSVFLISSKPYIFSNGYQICFNEEPSPECNIGYIVPEWVDENPSLSDIQNVYGPLESLPTTIIILPLKIEKESAVKQQLSNLHPEVLLFLSKIRQLSVSVDSDDSKCNTGCKISISGEDNCQTRRTFSAESYPLHLIAQMGDKGDEEQCCYYMWKQRFPVKQECISKKRAEVDEWVITLAFPFGRRLNRGMRKSSVYSFLPTEMETGFPFIIQADFLLVSSRESIQLNSPWNEGILSCVPSAFMNAFTTLITGAHEAPSFSIPFLFNFIPVEESRIKLLDPVRLSIKEKIIAEHIIPCELNNSQKMFCKPSEIKRLVPAFWSVLIKAQKSEDDILNLHSHGSHIVNAYLDNDDYNNVLGFLGVGYVDLAWYASFIQGSDLPKGMPDDIYVELLHFIVQNWNSCFMDLPLLRFIDATGGISLLSVSQATNGFQKLCIANGDEIITWLINWNREFISVSKLYFMPQTTQVSLKMAKSGVMDWLRNSVKLQSLSLYDYGSIVIKSLTSSKLVIAFTHFLYHSCKYNYARELYINTLLSQLPIVDEYGKVIVQRTAILKPASMSKWAILIGSNPWKAEKYVVLSKEYLAAANLAGNVTCEGQILKFLQKHGMASDVPQVYPPNASFRTVYSPLTKENVFLLLEWIRNIRSRRTNDKLQNFFNCIKTGSWLKTSIGYKPPSESFLPSSGWGRLLQVASTLIDIPLIQKDFYGEKITEYIEELKEIGVRFDFMDASEYIGSHLRSATADSTLTRSNVFSLLKLVRYLGEVSLSPQYLIQSTSTARWLKTSVGFRFPSESILLDSEWTLASHVSNLPFIDACFYGEQIADYKTELQLFGVLVGFKKNYQIVVDNFKMPSCSVSADAAIFILECVRNAIIPDDLFRKLSQIKWLKTQLGYQNPGESILFDPEWSLQRNDGPFIDDIFYGSEITSHKNELEEIGVSVDATEACMLLAHHIKCHSDITTISRVYLFLNEHKWEADDKAAEWIWIPSGGGEWVSSNSCILHDELDLFGSQLFILDKYYDTALLEFFSRVFGVRHGPLLDDYCKLWSSWEVSAHHITVQQCSAFWVFIVEHWNRNTETLLLQSISKLPVQSNDQVILSNKQDVFIPDDLLLKELFDKVSGTIFVWYPQVTTPALSRANMNKIYSSIGVQSISEAVEKDESFRTTGSSVREINQKSLTSNNGLLRIVLAFLSDTALDIIANERHRIVKYLLDLGVLEIDEPITVSYKLTLSSGTILDSKSSRMFHWEKDKAKLFLKRDGRRKRKRHNIEYATDFADVIAKGLLFEMPDQISSLAELIRLGCLLDFEEDAVDYLLKIKNLHLYPEDEEFLSSISSTKNARLKLKKVPKSTTN